MNPAQCPDCECYDTKAMGGGTHMCSGCGMVWSPGNFEAQYSQQELDYNYTSDDGDRYALEDMDPEDADFTPCPLCSSTNVVGLVDISGDLAGRYMCRTCACEFTVHESMESLEDEEEEETIHGVVLVCPHCASVDTIEVYGDNEWCGECWLDPNDSNVSSPNIAKLYKGGIKGALERDVPLIKPHKLMGKFLRSECGPHCSMAKNCPQQVGNLVKCFREEISDEEEDTVGRKRGRKKGRKKGRQQNHGPKYRKQHKHSPPKVAFFCAKGGLLEKMMYGITDPDTEQPGNTGSQSGA